MPKTMTHTSENYITLSRPAFGRIVALWQELNTLLITAVISDDPNVMRMSTGKTTRRTVGKISQLRKVA
jgi:hypothetical protein